MRDLSLYLVIDQGGHATRALIFDQYGEIHSQSTVSIRTNEPATGRVEHDAAEILASVRRAIDEAYTALPPPLQSRKIAAAGLATQRSSIVCWSRRTRAPLTPVISWQDLRARGILADWQPQAERIRAITGLVPSPHYGAGKIRWCLDHIAEVAQAQRAHNLACGPLASFLVASLTACGSNGASDPNSEGVSTNKGASQIERVPNRKVTPKSLTAPISDTHPVYCDPANASRTLLFNVTQQSWDRTLLRDFGIPAQILPLPVPTRYRYGLIVVQGARVPLKIVTGDQSAVIFQNGAPKPGTLYVNIGTGAFLQCTESTLPNTPPGMLRSVVMSEAQHTVYAIEGTVNGAGSALSWFSQHENVPDWSAHAAQWLEAESGEVLFLNTVGGLGSPFWVTTHEPRFVGQGSKPQLFKAVVESIVFLIFSNVECMRSANVLLDRIVMSGGIAALDRMGQGLADLCGLSVNRPNSLEATARGVAQLLAKPGIAWNSTMTSHFTPQDNTALITRYKRWRQTLENYIGGRTAG